MNYYAKFFLLFSLQNFNAPPSNMNLNSYSKTLYIFNQYGFFNCLFIKNNFHF